jgi:hypothetical protein
VGCSDSDGEMEDERKEEECVEIGVLDGGI